MNYNQCTNEDFCPHYAVYVNLRLADHTKSQKNTRLHTTCIYQGCQNFQLLLHTYVPISDQFKKIVIISKYVIFKLYW
jgi:hypothetical protein